MLLRRCAGPLSDETTYIRSYIYGNLRYCTRKSALAIGKLFGERLPHVRAADVFHNCPDILIAIRLYRGRERADRTNWDPRFIRAN